MGQSTAKMGEKIKESTGKAYETVTGRGACEHQPQHKQYSLPPKSPELNEKDWSFLKEHTGKSEDEIRRLFEKYNLNKPDGKLKKDEFIELYQQLHPESKNFVNDVADHVYRAFDSECTGYINFNEFMVAYALTSRGDMNKKLDYAFDLYDVNHNGSLEQNELRSVVTGMCDLLGVDRKFENPQQVIEEAVRDVSVKEGRINKSDFINGLMRNDNIKKLMSPFSTGTGAATTTETEERRKQQQQQATKPEQQTTA